MTTSDFFALWLHIGGLVVYGGATVALLAMVLPAAQAIDDPVLRRKSLNRALRVYDPLAIAALGVVVMSGATSLTTYKNVFRAEFFAKLGWLLVWKLSLAFAVIMVGTYLTFGVAHRIVRSELLEDPADPAWLDSMIRRLRGGCILLLALLAVTMWLGLELGHPRPV